MDTPMNVEVIAAFSAFLAERASAGVAAAKAVSSVRMDSRTLTVEFDHEVAGFGREALVDALPFENWAEFVGVPIAFDNSEGNRLRSAVESVATRLADGQDMGSLTAAELFKKGTGRDL